MQIFKHIKSVKYHIEQLKKQIEYIRDRKKLKAHIAMINDLIMLINDVEFMLDTNISAPVIDKVILHHIHTMMDKYLVDGQIDMAMLIKDYNDALNLPANYHRDQIVNKLKGMELDAFLNELPVKETGGHWKKWGIVFPKTQIDLKKNEVNNAIDRMRKLTTNEEWVTLINRLLTEFKFTARWN